MKRFFVILVVGFCAAVLVPQGYFILNKTKPIPTQEASAPYSGLGIYLINLDRSPDRLKYVAPQIQKLGWNFHRIAGVDGAALTEAEIDQKVDAKAYQKYMGHLPKRGMIGCNLSHAKAWQTFLASSYEYALVFEDDVSFAPEELRKVLTFLMQNPISEIVSFEVAHSGMPLKVRNLEGYQQVIYLTEVSHTGAYLLNRKAARVMLEKFLPMQLPIDHFFMRSWEFGLTVTGMEPRLVKQSLGTSDIAQTKRIERDSPPLHKYLQRGIYKLQSYIIRFVYSLKRYIELTSRS